jgi:tetratricopeptide (TPR) repeat protein
MRFNYCRIVRRLLVGGLVLLGAGISAGAPEQGRPQDVVALGERAEARLQRGVDAEDPATVQSAVETLRRCTRLDPGNAVRVCELARAEYRLEALAEQKGDTRTARNWLAQAIADARQAIALDGNSADAHTLLADLYGTKIGLEGFWAAVRFGSAAESETKTALRLDPDDPRVQLTLGRRYLYSPRMFGGDLGRAIAAFRKAVQLAPDSDEALRWLAIALLKAGDRKQAAAVLDQALRLNPRSAATRRLRAQAS